MDEYYLLKQMKREMLGWVCVRIDEFESVLNRMWKRDIEDRLKRSWGICVDSSIRENCWIEMIRELSVWIVDRIWIWLPVVSIC